MANVIRMEISGNVQGDVKLNVKTLYLFWCSKGNIRNISGETKGIKLKHSDKFEEILN